MEDDDGIDYVADASIYKGDPKITSPYKGDKPVYSGESLADPLDVSGESVAVATKTVLSSGGTYQVVPFTKFHDSLPGGAYTASMDAGILYLVPQRIISDKLFPIPNPTVDAVLKSIGDFSSEEVRLKYKERGFVHKRGYLFYGPPGTSKTVTIKRILRMCVERHNAICVLNPHPRLINDLIQILKGMVDGKDRQIIIVLEEFEQNLQHHEDEMLNLMDGIYNNDNIVYLCSTNYIDTIHDRIKSRPSRIAELHRFDLPSDEERTTFLRFLTGVDDPEFIRATTGMSFDQIKEVYISTSIFGIPFADVISRIRKTAPSAEDCIL
jgi:hypothetical protein